MIVEETILTCSCCGKTFGTKYFHGGSIEHDNYTNDHNMKVFANNFLESINEKDRYNFFKRSLDFHLQPSEEVCYRVCISIFECRILWLENNGYADIARYMKVNKENIKLELNKLLDSKIEKLEKKIDRIKGAMIK